MEIETDPRERGASMEEKRTWKTYRNQKEFVVRARMDVRSINKLDACCRILETSRSDILRRGIDRLYEELTEK